MGDQQLPQDRNFDDIAEKFSRNIYGTSKGDVRQAVLWQDLHQLLSTMPAGPLRVLDAGGGEGQTACAMAALGHDVIVCDISEQMLHRAQTLARTRGLTDRIQFIPCSAQEVYQAIDRPVDLLLFHAVLEWVAQPQQALQALSRCIAPNGVLSLMFYNYHALLFRNVTLGNFGYVDIGMYKKKKRTLSPDHPLKPEQVYHWLTQLDMTILGKSGIRVFHDYMQNKQKQQQAFDELLALEQRYCRQEPYINFGRYIHVMAQKSEQRQKDKL